MCLCIHIPRIYSVVYTFIMQNKNQCQNVCCFVANAFLHAYIYRVSQWRFVPVLFCG